MRSECLGLAAILALAAACSSSSTSTPCSSEATITAQVHDIDVDSDTNFICNATVTIAPATGGASVTLSPQGFDGSNVNCVYVTNVAPGTYTLSASASGYSPSSQTLDVTTVSCVATAQNPQIALMEVPGDGADAGSDAGAEGGGGVFRDGAAFGDGG